MGKARSNPSLRPELFKKTCANGEYVASCLHVKYETHDKETHKEEMLWSDPSIWISRLLVIC